MAQRPLSFAVIGADHAHIHGMVTDLTAAGGTCKGWWTREEPETAGGTIQPFPGIPRVADYRVFLDDPAVELVLVAAVPNERAELSLQALRAGKDVVTDKPGATTLADLEKIRRTVSGTGRMWSVNFSERYRVRAAVKAAELVAAGAIGKVLQTVGIGPHRGLFGRRKPWFFRTATGGGIIGDLGAHQIDHFVFFTGSRSARVVTSSVANFTKPDEPDFEDFGEVLLHGDGGLGYARVDWLTPDAQPNPGDSRLIILGTTGTIEIRKYVDLAGQPGGDHLFLVRGATVERIDCSKVPLRYFSDIAHDVRERTTTNERPGHSFLVSELTLQAQNSAQKLGALAR